MKTSRGLIALLASAVFAFPCWAKTLTFQNELRGAVLVQTVTSIGGMTRLDKPALVGSGGMVTFKFDGDKLYTIYDARSNRVLAKGLLKQMGKPVCLGIIFNPRLPTKFAVVPRPVPLAP